MNQVKLSWLPWSWGSLLGFLRGRGTDSFPPSGSTDTMIKQLSQLSITRGNSIFINHFEVTPYWASSLVSAQKSIAPDFTTREKPPEETSDMTLYELKWPKKYELHDSCSVGVFKCGFLPWEARWAATALCSSPVLQLCHGQPRLHWQSWGAGRVPTQGIKLTWCEQEMSLENGNTRVFLLNEIFALGQMFKILTNN